MSKDKIPVFDIGDTLSPSIPLTKTTVKRFLEGRGVEQPPEFPVREVDQYSEKSVDKWLRKEEIEVDAGKTVNEIKRSKENALENSGAFEILSKLGSVGEAPGIISDNSLKAKSFHQELFNARGVEINGFVVSEELGEKKPSKKIFEEFLNRRGAEGYECIYFGNDTRRDTSARKVGMDFVWVTAFKTWGKSWKGRSIEQFNYEKVVEVMEVF